MNGNQEFEVAFPTPHQQVFAVISAFVLLILIIVLVRRRTIREEYSLLWLATGVGIVTLTLWRGLLEILVAVSGVGLPSSILFLAGILFLLLISVHLSAIVSQQRTMIKNLSIKVAILDAKVSRSVPEAEKGVRRTSPSERPPGPGMKSKEDQE